MAEQAEATEAGARELRLRALLPGKLVYGPEMLTLDCSIRDRSPRGVRIRLAAAEPLPRKVWFLDLRQNAAYAAEVIWRRHPEVGLLLPEPTRLEGLGGDEGILLRRLLADAQPRKANDLLPQGPPDLD